MDRVTREELARAMADGGTGNAQVVKDLERAFAGLFGAEYGLCTSSCTTALISALRAAGVCRGDRVAVSVLAPSMTGLAITALEARPVFVDCASPTSFGLSREGIEQAVRDEVTAAVLVPMWGYWDEAPEALGILRSAGIPIIVDAAQAPFLQLHGRLFSVVDVVCLSLHGRKPLRAGEGGVCLTCDPRLAERIVAVRNFGQEAAFTDHGVEPTGPFAAHFGVNFKINALGAAWCLSQLLDLEQVRARLGQLRQVTVDAFTRSGVGWSEATQSAAVAEHGRYGFVAMCSTESDGHDLARAIAADGVEVDSSRYRYAPMYTAPYFAQFASACPNAVRLTATAVACRLEAFAARLAPGRGTS